MIRDLVSMQDLERGDIERVVERAKAVRDQLSKEGRQSLIRSPPPALATLFYENSTRTRGSFVRAIQMLGGVAEGFSGAEGTSVMKNESILSTIKMFESYLYDGIVMRHPRDGSVQWAADVARIPVISGGDGKNEHPTQAMLDLTTYHTFHGRLDGIRIGYGGDLVRGRTIHSQTLALSHFQDVEILYCTPDHFAMPEHLEHALRDRGVRVSRTQTMDEMLRHVDFVYMTRPQLERMTDAERVRALDAFDPYRLTPGLLQGFEGRVLHPLPINAEIQEIEAGVFAMAQQGFLFEAHSGLLTRVAILEEVLAEARGFDETLPDGLLDANNRVPRYSRGHAKGSKAVRDIDYGIVIDHIPLALVGDVQALLPRDGNLFTGHVEGKGLIKLETRGLLPERTYKQIAKHAPGATFNHIAEGAVIEGVYDCGVGKFLYLLCTNANCVSRDVIEDIPPKFYYSEDAPGDGVMCRYCRHETAWPDSRLTPTEKLEYIKALPQSITPL